MERAMLMNTWPQCYTALMFHTGRTAPPPQYTGGMRGTLSEATSR